MRMREWRLEASVWPIYSKEKVSCMCHRMRAHAFASGIVRMRSCFLAHVQLSLDIRRRSRVRIEWVARRPHTRKAVGRHSSESLEYGRQAQVSVSCHLRHIVRPTNYKKWLCVFVVSVCFFASWILPFLRSSFASLFAKIARPKIRARASVCARVWRTGTRKPYWAARGRISDEFFLHYILFCFSPNVGKYTVYVSTEHAHTRNRAVFSFSFFLKNNMRELHTNE